MMPPTPTTKDHEMSELGEIAVGDAVLTALGLTREELAEQGLRAFANRAYELGYEITVSSRPALGRKGRLSITMDTSPAAPTPGGKE